MILQNSTDIKTEIFYDGNNDIAPIDIRFEKHTINPNGLIQLQNIPSPLHTVFTIKGKNGINVVTYNKAETLVNQYDFIVDYVNGILTFHSSQVGREIQVSYTNSIGRISISADRVFTNVDNRGNIVQTLGTLLKEGEKTLSDLSVLGGASKVISELKGYLDSIKELTGNIIQGSNVNTQLVNSTNTAKSTNATLNSTITNANSKISEMNKWVESHSDIVNLDNRVDATEVKLNTVNASLEQKVSKEDLSAEARSKRVQGENTKTDIKGTFDSANFAGQDLGKNAPIGNVMHHYTDGIEFQIDNVGEDNNILILKNAYNPSRRPDKPSDFVGTGTFLECLKAVIGSTSLSMFRVDKDGNLLWTDKTDTTQFISNKADDNKSTFQFKCYKEHKNLLEIINAGMWELTVKHENNQCVLQSGNKPTNGLKLEAQLGVLDLNSKGDINLNPTSKRVNLHAVTYIYEGTNYNRVVTTRSGALTGRPTSGQYVGMQYLDTSLGTNGKVIWWNGTNWIDASGNIV